MLSNFIHYLADQPAIFSFLRKIVELNFFKQKRLIKKTLYPVKDKKILDIGCGTGEFSNLFIQSDYHGIDISDKYIEYAKQKKHGKFSVMDATKLDFPDNNFDYILIMAILHHLDDTSVTQVIIEAKRVLKPGGKVLIMEDAKIEELENPIIRWMQKSDKGAYIRRPSAYKKLINIFNIDQELSFKNGLCIYHSFTLHGYN